MALVPASHNIGWLPFGFPLVSVWFPFGLPLVSFWFAFGVPLLVSLWFPIAFGWFSYAVYLWATPILVTVDLEVDARTAIAASEWLSANVLLDCVPRGQVCYIPSERCLIPMTDMPSFARRARVIQ